MRQEMAQQAAQAALERAELRRDLRQEIRHSMLVTKGYMTILMGLLATLIRYGLPAG